MTSDDHTQTWEFFSEAAAFDGSAEQIDDWAKRYSCQDLSFVFWVVANNKTKFLSLYSKDEAINIVKALVHMGELEGRKLDGSTPPAVPIIKLLREDHPEECDELDKWVLENSSCAWLPWGRTRGRFKSWQEVDDDYWRRRDNADAEEERQEEAHAAKLERDKAKAQHNIYNAIRRKDIGAIDAMIAKGADLDKPNDEGKSPRAYAEELGDEKVLRRLG
jgi:hypothetical protein